MICRHCASLGPRTLCHLSRANFTPHTLSRTVYLTRLSLLLHKHRTEYSVPAMKCAGQLDSTQRCCCKTTAGLQQISSYEIKIFIRNSPTCVWRTRRGLTCMLVLRFKQCYFKYSTMHGVLTISTWHSIVN